MNYGGIGMVIGHEITHGFDDRGRRFDAKGNLRDWWTAEDAKRYEARAALVVKQFDAFVGVEGVHVNGKLTLGENISDLGGLKIAFTAMQKARSRARRERRRSTASRPSSASSSRTPRAAPRCARAGADLPQDRRALAAAIRVRGPLENLPEFARAFSCDAAKKPCAPTASASTSGDLHETVRIALLAALAAALPGPLDPPAYPGHRPLHGLLRLREPGVAEAHRNPADRSSWGVSAELQKRNEALIRGPAEAAKNPPPEGSARRKALDFYRAAWTWRASSGA